MDLTEFEFSQNHLLFWDKLEKANFWLEGVIATSDRDVDDRTVAHLMSDPIGDGGQWNMFVALVRKHGLVPKSAMPETVASSSTRQLNRDLKAVLRQAARDLRRPCRRRRVCRRPARPEGRHAADGPPDALAAPRHPAGDGLLAVDGQGQGLPPRRAVTPQEFAQRYVDLDLDSYVCLVDDPRPTSPRNRVFTVEHLGNVVSGEPVTYLNVEMPLIKRLARESIVGGTPVWFGCDVGQMMEKERGCLGRPPVRLRRRLRHPHRLRQGRPAAATAPPR